MWLCCCRWPCASAKVVMRYYPRLSALAIVTIVVLVTTFFLSNRIQLDTRPLRAQYAALLEGAFSVGAQRTDHAAEVNEVQPNYLKAGGVHQGSLGQAQGGGGGEGIQPAVSSVTTTSDKQAPSTSEHSTQTDGAVPLILDSGQNKTQNILHRLAKNRYFKPDEVQLKNGYWQVVGGPIEIYLYTAHFDDRPTLSRRYVRVIGIFQVPVVGIFCLLWYANETYLTDAEILKIGVRYPRHGKYFDPSLASCALPKDTGVPTHVSIMTSSGTTCTTLLEVNIPEKPQIAPHEFGVCVSVSYWRHSPVRVVEWLELHKMWGVGEVNVYNNSLANDTARVLQHYANEGFVNFRQAPNCMEEDDEMTILMNMSPVINDCMYRNLYRYKHIICVDFDELIVPRKHNNYHELIDATNHRFPSHHRYRSYMARNVYFFFDFGPVTTVPWFLITMQYFRRVPPSEYGFSVKTITHPMSCVGLQNHVCWHLVPGLRTEGWLTEISPDVAMNQHYKKCHLEVEGKGAGACLLAMQNVTEDRAIQRFDKLLEYRAAQSLIRLDLL